MACPEAVYCEASGRKKRKKWNTSQVPFIENLALKNKRYGTHVKRQLTLLFRKAQLISGLQWLQQTKEFQHLHLQDVLITNIFFLRKMS